MSKKKNNLSRKVASFIAGSLGLLSVLGSAYLNQTNLQHLSNENSIQIPSNQQLKPQLYIRFDFENPPSILAGMGTLNSLHYSNLMGSSESLSEANKKVVFDVLKTFLFHA